MTQLPGSESLLFKLEKKKKMKKKQRFFVSYMTAICTRIYEWETSGSEGGMKGLIVRVARARGQRSQPHHSHRQVTRLGGNMCVKRDCGDGGAAVDSTPRHRTSLKDSTRTPIQ